MLSGFGGINRSNTHHIFQRDEIETFNSPSIARGQGKAYGDASTIQNGNVIKMDFRNKITNVDSEKKTITVQSGITIGSVLEYLSKINATLEVVPGSSFISVGGCVASDIHGKNHSQKGSFSEIIVSFTLQTSENGVLLIDDKNSSIYKSTVGGMGLTGIIEEVTLKYAVCNSLNFVTKKISTSTLHQTLLILSQQIEKAEFNIAWIDLSTSKNFGRGIIYSSNRMDFSISSLTTKPKLFKIPQINLNLMTRIFTKFHNKIRFNLETKSSRKLHIESFWKVYFPSDLFIDWNNLFGRKGLMEYQFLAPYDNLDVIEKVLRELCKMSNPALAAIKILGKPNNNYLSFPEKGYLVGVTFPWKKTHIQKIYEIDQLIVSKGFKKYLSKDAITNKSTIIKMYPKLNDFLEVKKIYDSNEVWQSDLYKRVLK